MEPLTVNEKTAAATVGLSHDTLKRLRLDGTGPRYLRVRRAIRYPVAGLHSWVDEQCRVKDGGGAA